MIKLQIDGIADLEAALRAVGKKAAREAALVAVQHACEPIVKIAKAYAARDTGALAESITWRVRPYRRGDKVVGVIGPGSKFRGPDGRRPAKYAHLVERGHAKVGGGTVPADPFMAPAINAGSGQAMRALSDTFSVALNIKAEQLAEVKKARKNKRKA